MNNNPTLIFCLAFFSAFHISFSQVQIKTLESKTDPHNCEISIHYPVYPLDGAKRLNDSIFQYIEVQKDNFLRDAKSYYSDLDSDDIEYGRFPFITIDVTSFYVTQSFASYCLEIAECPSYGCHGTNQYVTFNFDILRQQFLSPKDLFLTPDSGVCQVLCQYLDSAKIGCDIWRTTKFQKCNLSDLSVNVEEKNIVFNFSAYALGPGWYRVSVPRQKFALKVHD